MFADEVMNNSASLQDAYAVRSILEKYDRSKILEIYFSRMDGRVHENIPLEYSDLYQMSLEDIKHFLSGQHSRLLS
jgi:hypothetical protein